MDDDQQPRILEHHSFKPHSQPQPHAHFQRPCACAAAVKSAVAGRRVPPVTAADHAPDPKRDRVEGRLYVVSAPSGAGKTSLVKALMEREPALRFSVSYTTRKPRSNEVDGRDYHFVSPAQFAEMAERGEFLEHAQVFDNFYATGLGAVRDGLAAGQQLLLEIDWQGARQVRKSLPAARSVFILPPTRRALEERLKARSTDSIEVIRRRLQDAQRDIAHWKEFDYVLINDRFEQAVDDFQSIIQERGEALAASRPEVVRLAAELLA